MSNEKVLSRRLQLSWHQCEKLLFIPAYDKKDDFCIFMCFLTHGEKLGRELLREKRSQT